MRHVLNLWHALECPHSMRVRIVLAEKDELYASHVVSVDDVGPDVRIRTPKGKSRCSSTITVRSTRAT